MARDDPTGRGGTPFGGALLCARARPPRWQQ